MNEMSKKKQENIEKEVIGQPPEDIAEAAEPELTPLEKAEKEAAEYKDMALRARAEFENYRKNNLNLAKEVRERTTADVLESILPVYDSFDRAMEAVTDSCRRISQLWLSRASRPAWAMPSFRGA